MRLTPLLLLLTLVPTWGQVSKDSGDLTGTVSGQNGEPRSDQELVLTDLAHGYVWRTKSVADGSYRFSGLLPGGYSLKLESATSEFVEIRIRLGETALIPVIVSDTEVATFRAEATTERPLVDPERTQPAQLLDTQQLRELPINQRNYLDLSYLTPSIISSDIFPDNIDKRIPSNPTSGLSINGNNGRYNMISLDGAENLYNSGGVRPPVSQDAIEEFQVSRMGFSVETGFATGGAINIVTRSGGNEWHGTLFGFLRDRSLQARNYFDPQKSPFRRWQTGASLGGPIRKDRTFIFGSFEALIRRESALVPILRDQSVLSALTPDEQTLISALPGLGPPGTALAGELQDLLNTTNYPATTQLFAKNSGVFPFQENSYTGLLRLDHRWNDRRSIAVRLNLTADNNDDSSFGSLIAYSRGHKTDLLDQTIAATLNLVHSTSTASQFRFSFGRYRFDVNPLEAYGPQLDIEGYGLFQRDAFLPALAREDHGLAQYSLTRFAGRHVWKFGAEFNLVRNSSFSNVPNGGIFDFGSGIPLSSLLNEAVGNPNFAGTLGQTFTAVGQSSAAAALNSPITALQAFNIGLPLYYTQTFGSPDWVGWFRRAAAYAQDTIRIRPDFQLNIGVRYEVESKASPFRTRRDHLAPRFGFVWSPGPDHRTAVRGGYGMYYGPVLNSLAYLAEHFPQLTTVFVPLTGLPGAINSQTGLPVTSADIYTGLLSEGILGQRYVLESDLAQFGIHPGPNLPYSVLYQVDKAFTNPLSHQASLEVEHSTAGFDLSLALTGVRGLHEPWSLDKNIYQAGTMPDGLPIFGLVDPSILQRNVFQSSANSTYAGMTLSAIRRPARGISLQAHYTWSKTLDDTTDFDTVYQPMNQTDAKAEWALSTFNVAHRVVATAVMESPDNHSTRSVWLRNWVFSPALVAQSGRPFNLLTGYDNLGDGHPDTKRPIGAGRNIGRGPDMVTLDARLTRRFALREKVTLNLLAEAFNSLNHTNFLTLNNVVGAIPLSSLQLTGNRGPVSSPLAFTSAADPRQIQLGIRIIY